jgi:hypothetical protein
MVERPHGAETRQPPAGYAPQGIFRLTPWRPWRAALRGSHSQPPEEVPGRGDFFLLFLSGRGRRPLGCGVGDSCRAESRAGGPCPGPWRLHDRAAASAVRAGAALFGIPPRSRWFTASPRDTRKGGVVPTSVNRSPRSVPRCMGERQLRGADISHLSRMREHERRA